MYPILLLVVQCLVTASVQADYDLPSQLLVDVNDGNVREVIASSQYFFLDFYVSRKDMAIPLDPVTSNSTFPVAERFSHHTQLKFGKIETKNNPVISKEIGVQQTTYATKVLFKEGKVVEIIDTRSRELYIPDMLYNWLMKRVEGPILQQQVPVLSESQAAVLALTDTPSPHLSTASLNLTEIMFYQQPGDVEFGGRVLLKGGTYVLRNFLGASSVEPLELSLPAGELLEQIRKLTIPLVERLTPSVLDSVYMKQQWTLGLLVTTSKSKHKETLDMYVSSVSGLKDMLPDPQQLKGVYVDNDDTAGEREEGPGTFYERLLNHFGMSDVDEGSIRVFLFKENGPGKEGIKTTMKTELTQHNIKSFFFEEVQKNLLEENMAKKRTETKRSELPPPNWKEKMIKPLVRSTLREWVTGSNAELLILLCHGGPSRTLTKTLLTVNKLQKKFKGVVEIGKLNTGLNDVDMAVPGEGFVRVKIDGSGKISSEILSRGNLDDDPLVEYLLSNLQSNKDEL